MGVTGWADDQRQIATSNELIVLDNEKSGQKSCKFPNYWQSTRSTGGFLRNTPVFCGGSEESLAKSCFRLDKRSQNQQELSTMSTERFAPSSVVIPSRSQSGKEEDLWVMGGTGTTKGFSSRVFKRTTEYVDFGKLTKYGPDLPIGLGFHCSIKINSTTIMVMGGLETPTRVLKGTYYFHLDSASDSSAPKWISGPNLKTQRIEQACGVGRVGTITTIVITAGGAINGKGTPIRTKSSEILQLDGEGKTIGSGKTQWDNGPDLPKPLKGAAGVSVENGERFLVIGGNTSTQSGFQNWILELQCSISGSGGKQELRDACKWITLEQRLQEARTSFAAIYIPPENNFC